jgi:UDP-N-acetylglucosamine diphosphorylase/glucosamine-1-phosphate N-acetyltransferase
MSIKTATFNGVATLEIARPERKNALTQAMYQAMSEAILAAQADDAVRAVLITGQPGIFTSGNDLEDFMQRASHVIDSPTIGFMHTLAACEKPVVAAVTGAAIGIGVIFDTSTGPILVDRGAEVRHGSVITGPAWIGPKCIVMDRSVIKARTVLGPQCRGAGEIGSAIFQACSNKAHDGHLGDALLGEWVNLGAGTVNSNLLNTYGEVAMRLSPDAPLERTGRQFMGCIVGDHVKLAIGTRVMTGTSIGTGTMWASGKAVSGAVGSFAWVTDDGERRFRLDKFMDIARTVMARRGREPGAAECARLSALHGAGAG